MPPRTRGTRRGAHGDQKMKVLRTAKSLGILIVAFCAFAATAHATVSAPEIDPSFGIAGLVLLGGALMMVFGTPSR